MVARYNPPLMFCFLQAAFLAMGGLHALLALLSALQSRSSILVALAAALLRAAIAGFADGKQAVISAGGALLLCRTLEQGSCVALGPQAYKEHCCQALAELLLDNPDAQVRASLEQTRTHTDHVILLLCVESSSSQEEGLFHIRGCTLAEAPLEYCCCS